MQAPTCSDAFKNGDESDVDCGGSCKAKCATAKRCNVASDCKSRICGNGTCKVSGIFLREVALCVQRCYTASKARDAAGSFSVAMLVSGLGAPWAFGT